MGRLILGLALMFQLTGAVPAPLISNADLRALMVVYWKMDEAANTTRRTAFPAPATTTDLTPSTVAQVAGLVYANTSGFTKASSQVVSHLDSEADGFGTLVDKTLCQWVYPTVDNANFYFGSMDDDDSNVKEWIFRMEGQNPGIIFEFNGVDSDGFTNTVVSTSYDKNVWHLVCATMDNTALRSKISVDGGAWTQAADPVTAFTAGGSDFDFHVGAGSSPTDPLEYFTGRIGPVMIFSAILTGPQLVRLYNARAGLALY